MHQTQQHQDMPRPPCARCGGAAFSHTPILDPKTSRTVHLFRCKTCASHQWADDEDSGS